jgi:hypothetical protein
MDHSVARGCKRDMRRHPQGMQRRGMICGNPVLHLVKGPVQIPHGGLQVIVAGRQRTAKNLVQLIRVLDSWAILVRPLKANCCRNAAVSARMTCASAVSCGS